jgi:hypothetical protein
MEVAAGAAQWRAVDLATLAGAQSRISPPTVEAGDHWVSMWLQLMWLQLESVLGPVGVVTGPKSTTNDPDRTSDNLKLQPHKL